MQTSNYTGVILAAGRGTRMAPFNDDFPKAMLPICNKPLIQYQIETMRGLGILDIVVLVGHKGFEIAKVLGDGSKFGVTLRYVEQTTMLGIAHAVGRLESHIHRPFLLFLGDIYFVPGDLAGMFRMFEEQGGGAVLATKEEHDPAAIRRNYSITLGADGYVTRVIEKPRYTSNRIKGVGLYLFDLTIFDAIRRTPRTAMRDEYEITDAIQVMVDDGHRVRAAYSILDDINLTSPTDLLHCNLLLAGQLPQEQLVGQRLSAHPQARIHNSIIGANVTIANAIEISNSVVLDNSMIDSVTDFDHCIITPQRIVDCKYGTELARAGK
jgi:dTDP-glucose pyrophosphorylase